MKYWRLNGETNEVPEREIGGLFEHIYEYHEVDVGKREWLTTSAIKEAVFYDFDPG